MAVAVDDPFLITDDVWKKCTEQARYVVYQYENNPKANSVYKPSFEGTRRGFIAEELLANYLGRQRVSVRKPWEGADIAPDIEVRSVKHPYKKVMWERLALSLYNKDLKHLERRYVLASVSEDDVRFWGWEYAKNIVFPEAIPVQKFEGTGTYDLWGYAYPDELRPFEEFLDDCLGPM